MRCFKAVLKRHCCQLTALPSFRKTKNASAFCVILAPFTPYFKHQAIGVKYMKQQFTQKLKFVVYLLIPRLSVT